MRDSSAFVCPQFLHRCRCTSLSFGCVLMYTICFTICSLFCSVNYQAHRALHVPRCLYTSLRLLCIYSASDQTLFLSLSMMLSVNHVCQLVLRANVDAHTLSPRCMCMYTICVSEHAVLCVSRDIFVPAFVCRPLSYLYIFSCRVTQRRRSLVPWAPTPSKSATPRRWGFPSRPALSPVSRPLSSRTLRTACCPWSTRKVCSCIYRFHQFSLESLFV